VDCVLFLVEKAKNLEIIFFRQGWLFLFVSEGKKMMSRHLVESRETLDDGSSSRRHMKTCALIDPHDLTINFVV
jgi:hypothetical protein